MEKYTSGRQKNLKVGIVSYSENLTSLEVVGNGYFTGIITASNFSGNASSATYATNAGVSTYATSSGIATYATNAGIATYATSSGIATYATSSGIATYATTSGVSTSVIGGISSVTQLSVSGISTLGITSTTNLTTQQINISGLSTFSGIVTHTTSLFGTQASFTGVVTASSFSGNASSATYATSSGIATALQNARNFSITGNFVTASAITFDGTGNVALAATIAPDSIGLGTYTSGDYVKNIFGTSNQITVTGGTGEGSTPTLSIPSQFTAPQDVTVTRDLQVNRNLNVTGNITIGGTSAIIYATELKVSDPDLVLGIRTDGSGNDISNDTTANHGGIAIASTEGNPLVSLYNPGIGESTPATYKKIMWFKSGAFTGLNTDAWLINYAVGIGSTQFPVGTRLAAGNVQFTQNDLAVVRNINASGVVTATTFVGALTGTATSTTNIPNLSGDITSNNNVTTLATVNSNVGTYGGTGAIPVIAVNGKGLVTGVSTVAPNNGTLTLGVSGTGLSGSATFTANQSGSSTFTVTSNATDANTASSIVARDSSGNFSAGTITANLTGTASSATYATSAGVSTSVISGVASVSQLNVSGISTVGFLTATNIFNSGVTTSSSFVKINGTSSQFLKADGSVDSNTYLTAETDTLNSITGRGNVTSNGISVGVLTATSGNFSGIVTSSGANISGVTTSSGFNATVGNDYKIDNTSVLTSTTLGSGVVNSSLTSVGTLGSLTVTNVASASTFKGNLTGTATTANNISSGSTGNIFYQSSPGITTFLTNGTAGFILQSNGVGNAPSWVAAAPSSAISGLTIQDNTTQKGVANSITTLNFSGLNVSATASGGISTISISNNLVGTALSISQITTLSSTTLIGGGTSTGTAGQILQVSGISSDAYIGGSVGIGSTNPTSKLYVVGDTYITGILTANRIISNVYGEFTGGSISGTNIVGTALSISGISTVGFLTATNIFNSGVTTSSSFVKINGTSSQFLKADGSVDSSTYLTTTGSGTNLTGIVTSIIAGTNISVSGSTGQITINSTSGSLDILEVMLFS